MRKSVLVSLFCMGVVAAIAQNTPGDRQQFAALGDFKLENGAVIKDCQVGYRVYGQLNSAKTNGILFPSWYGGT